MNQRLHGLLPYLILFTGSFLLCWYMLGDRLFHLDEIMLNGYGDGLKNNYTFIYHALYGQGIHFEGMNYPYGEHITYTDGQPLLLMLENQFGWINSIHSGVLTINVLVLASLLFTPFIIFRILRFYRLPVWVAVTGALFIAFHSSQIYRIVSHYSLSYAFAIPLCYDQYLRYFHDYKKYRSFRR